MLNSSIAPSINNISILFEEGLSVSLDLRRRTQGFWERVNQGLLAKLQGPQREIRGIGLAADHLVRALATNGTATRLTLRHDREAENSADEYARHLKIAVTRQVEIKQEALSDRFGINPGSTLPDIWLNLSPYQTRWGGVERSQAIRLASSASEYPIITLLHGLSAHGMLSSVFFPLLLGGSLPCDTLVATSAAAAEAVKSILAGVSESFAAQYGIKLSYRGRVDTIPLCIDTEQPLTLERNLSRKKLDISHSAFVLLYIGRISPLKADLAPFIHMLSRLAKRYPQKNLLWVVAGTAEEGYAEQLLRAAVALGVDKQLKIMLQMHEEMKQQLLSSADVFFSPSDSIQESCGLTPIEAMAAGLPQVVANWDGYRDTVVHGETGFLLPTYWTECDGDLRSTGSVLGWSYDHLCLGQSVAVDVYAAERALERLIESSDLRAKMAGASRKRAVALYSYSAIAHRYEELGQALREIKASQLGVSRPPEYSQPMYNRYFRQHASDWLESSSRLQLAPYGSDALRRWDEAMVVSHPMMAIDTVVLRRMLLSLEKAEGTALSLEEVCADVESVIGLEDRRRHVMWLLKQGWVSVAKSLTEEMIYRNGATVASAPRSDRS